MDPLFIKEALVKRLILIQKIKAAFYELFPGSKAKLHLHRVQTNRLIVAKANLEDTKANRDLVCEVLEAYGYEIVHLDGVQHYRNNNISKKHSNRIKLRVIYGR